MNVKLTCVLLLVNMLFYVCSCSTIGYYQQSISGHIHLIAKQERITDIVNDPQRDQKLVQQLRMATEIRNFANQRLRLPENDSYRSYVQLNAPYVTWNVFAAPRFSSTLDQWCFLVIGCVPYRGYFDKQEAQAFARRLSVQGKEVYIAGAPAYSTLGWFVDPLLSSMIDRGEWVTAAYIFHELAHQQFYLHGDGAFNEAFATAVEEIGVMLWLQSQGRLDEMANYQAFLKQQTLFFNFVKASRDKFEMLYRQDYDAKSMQMEKELLILEMRRKFTRLSDTNEYIGRYSKWMAGPLNNAQLGAISLYRERVPAFRRLFALCENRFDAFYAQVQSIAQFHRELRIDHLENATECK